MTIEQIDHINFHKRGCNKCKNHWPVMGRKWSGRKNGNVYHKCRVENGFMCCCYPVPCPHFEAKG